MEIDRLVQLLESPIFTYLRLHLLDRDINASLQDTLYGLLMCLPQTEAFQVLRRRLQCIPKLQPTAAVKKSTKGNEERDPSKRPLLKHINFEALLHHFCAIQEAHHTSSLERNVLKEVDHELLSSRH